MFRNHEVLKSPYGYWELSQNFLVHSIHIKSGLAQSQIDCMEKIGTLMEGSRSYHSRAKDYNEFSDAEDAPMKVLKFLKPKFKGKTILDVGCGSGKYAMTLAPLSKEYIGIDISKDQLKLAKAKTKNLKNVRFICCSAENIPLGSESVDVAISFWGAISVISGFRRKTKVINEVERVLKKGGSFYSVDNDSKGEYAMLRRHPKRTMKHYNWLMKKGFKVIKRIDTQFRFDSKDTAKRVMQSIFGEKVSKRINKNTIKHKVVIFSKAKS